MRTALPLALALALAACGGPPADAPETPAEADTTITPVDDALSRANRLEDRLALPDSRTRTIPVEDGPEDRNRLVRLWVEDDRPAVLHVEETDAAGRTVGQSMYYFDNGQLFFVRRPDERIVLQDGRIVAWLDERLQPVADTTVTARQSRAEELKTNLDRFLAPFSVAPVAE